LEPGSRPLLDVLRVVPQPFKIPPTQQVAQPKVRFLWDCQQQPWGEFGQSSQVSHRIMKVFEYLGTDRQIELCLSWIILEQIFDEKPLTRNLFPSNCHSFRTRVNPDEFGERPKSC